MIRELLTSLGRWLGVEPRPAPLPPGAWWWALVRYPDGLREWKQLRFNGQKAADAWASLYRGGVVLQLVADDDNARRFHRCEPNPIECPVCHGTGHAERGRV